ncbi:uncharacterized protein ACMZJ9_017708 [Mantella aurantiaca]
MPKCIFQSCPHFMGKNCFSPGITLHVFPKDLTRIKLWLQQTGQYYDDIDNFAEKILSSKMGSYRMCSAHFISECYMSQGAKMVLKPDAVPTVFPGNVVEVAIKHVPQKKKQRLEEREAGRRARLSQVDAGTSTIHILQTEMGTQTDLTMVTIQSCSVNVPRWNTYDRGIQWPEYEFNFYGEDWKVQLDHMYFNSRFKCVQELPNVDQEEIIKDHCQVPSTTQQPGSSTEDYNVVQDEPLKTESEPCTSSETPEGYFFSKCSLRNRKTLCILQAKLVALLRHMTEAPHMGSYKRQRTRKLLSQIVDIVCLVAGEDLKLVKKNEDLSKFYQKEEQIPVRYQDVAVFFTREEWDYIEENEDIYKKEILSDPNESKEDQMEDFIDDFEEDADITDDHFFKLLEVSSQGHSPGAAPVGRKRKKLLMPPMPCVSEYVPEGHGHEDRDWDNNRTCKSEYFSDIDDTGDEDGGCLRPLDPDVAKEETVSDSYDLKPTIKREECSQEVSTGWNTTHDSHETSGPVLWIAEDGTTSTHWMPRHGSPSDTPIVKRSRGRQKKLLKQLIVRSDTGGFMPNMAHNHMEHLKGRLRNTPASDCASNQRPSEGTLWCDLCNERFYSTAELETHQVTHVRGTLLRCEDCAEIFDTTSDLEKHKAKEHGKLRYPCEVCGLQYNYRSQYIIHQRTHTGEKPFCCKECGQAFGHKCSLLIHMRKHSGSSLFECGRCGKLLDTEQALEKHRKLRFCVNCKKCFTRRALRLHLKTHSPEETAKKGSTTCATLQSGDGLSLGFLTFNARLWTVIGLDDFREPPTIEVSVAALNEEDIFPEQIGYKKMANTIRTAYSLSHKPAESQALEPIISRVTSLFAASCPECCSQDGFGEVPASNNMATSGQRDDVLNKLLEVSDPSALDRGSLQEANTLVNSETSAREQSGHTLETVNSVDPIDETLKSANPGDSKEETLGAAVPGNPKDDILKGVHTGEPIDGTLDTAKPGDTGDETLEATDPGDSIEENSSTSNILSVFDNGSVSPPHPGSSLLIPSGSGKRGSRRKSKPKKLVVPEEEDGGSPLDDLKDGNDLLFFSAEPEVVSSTGADTPADGLQDSARNDSSASSKSRRSRKKKLAENFQKPYLSWRSGDTPSLMFVVPSNEMETMASTEKRKKPQKEVELQEMHWCDICDDCFASLSDLEMHQTTHIDNHEEDFDCEECGRVFDTATELEEHQSKKHGKMRYCCDICGIQYNYQSQFLIHMRAHSGERLFTCDECGKEFKHRCSLVIHQRRHAGETPHQCQKCGKMLDTRSALIKHEKMRYCPDCSKCYTHRGFSKHLIKNCIKP